MYELLERMWGEESAYRQSKANAAIRRPQWYELHEFVQKVLKVR